MTAETLTIPLMEAGRQLCMSRTMTYQMHRAGKFPVPVVQIGHKLVVSRALLEAFVEGSYQKEAS